jgi:hypothetical protein
MIIKRYAYKIYQLKLNSPENIINYELNDLNVIDNIFDLLNNCNEETLHFVLESYLSLYKMNQSYCKEIS